MTQPRHTEGAAEAEREAFEAWVLTQDSNPLSLARHIGPGYVYSDTHAAWRAWQAHAALSGWQPIETAPKDGSTILLGRAASEELDSDAISVPGYWQEGYEDGVDYMGCDSGFVDSPCQVFSGGRSFGSESHCYAPNQPTHWQPLPTPPTPNQGAES